ncbi:glutamate synthase [Pyrobaculum neutrophilum]|uniref:Glutamate synthase alpha subunit domain protein n=1 Tax=Pyrobaculum neutrophilum (strain DSM 2338 / JCM 9278 / NBRC 100436 / V24Sta) TaxID=444157 RepID=B1YDA4_PYRNV|nr:glutamate synthase [Pyrobaculum neutrophilum]ACB39767.1 glutamate synthase alpha subunit domain protein [Pyrobaculum neutrophilum V24Sta]
MCGIFGVYSFAGEYIPGKVAIKALTAMRERGTKHGSGVALLSPSPQVRTKFFTSTPPSDASEVYKLPSGLYDVVKYGDVAADGVVYMRSRWLDVYKVIGWPEALDELYGVGGKSSPIWIGHTRYPTNSPGGFPYYSHPFSVGDVAIVHNGDLSSYGSNINLLKFGFGYGGFTGNDSEAIAYLLWELTKRYGPEKAVEELMYGREVRGARLDGPYAVAFIIGGPKPVFGAFVDTQHFRPLYAGLSGDRLYVASEAAAIRAVAGNGVEIWALRGGEYIIASGGEVWGGFKKRAVYPEIPLPPPDVLDASAYGVLDLAPEVRRLLQTRGRVDVVNVVGHRYLGNGMEGGVLRVWGVVGNASANVMSGGEFYIYGDAQEDLGDAMNGGLIAVYGSVGDAVGQAKRGGEIYIYGNANNRAGIQHRGGVLVIGGSAGDYLGEYMGGGVILVLRHTWQEEVGRRIGAGMVGGAIYIRGEVERDKIGGGVDHERLERYIKALKAAGVDIDVKRASEDPHFRRIFSMYHSVEVRELTEEEVNALRPYVQRFNALFNEDVKIEREVFTVVKVAELQKE